MSYPGLDISGKVCLVSGVTTGIGLAIALALAASGASVVAGSSNPDKVAAVTKELGEKHESLRMDVADDASVRSAVEKTIARFGRLDAVINAAGIISRKPAIETSTAEFEQIVKVDLTGSFIVAREAAKVMKDQSPDARGQRGSMVLIASLNSYV